MSVGAEGKEGPRDDSQISKLGTRRAVRESANDKEKSWLSWFNKGFTLKCTEIEQPTKFIDKNTQPAVRTKNMSVRVMAEREIQGSSKPQESTRSVQSVCSEKSTSLV